MDSSPSGKKILFITGKLIRGGAEKVTTVLSNHWAEAGCDVTIVTLLDSSCNYELSERVNHVSMHYPGKNRNFLLPVWVKELRKMIRRIQPDVVVSFFARINIVSYISSCGLRVRLVCSERNDPRKDGRGFATKLLTQFIYPRCKAVVFQTQAIANCFSNRVSSRIICNPIDIPPLDRVQEETIPYSIVSVGKLMPQKNQAMLIEAFAEVHKQYPDSVLTIYGEGALREELESKVHQLELDGFVELPGNVLDVHKKMEDKSLFVMSSDYEGMSNALMEAMALGFPCISTNCSGANELIEDCKNGILIPVGDCAALVEAIVDVFENPDYAVRLSEGARASAARFSPKIVLGQWDECVFC